MAAGQKLSDGEIQKLAELEKKENEEMTTKFKAVLEKHEAKSDYRTVYHSKPGEAIIEAARSENATMIVMGTRGMGTIRRTIMGSVSDYVVHHADIPVIICRQ
jgi:nucleotide-binding universal stress UspA family protein